MKSRIALVAGTVSIALLGSAVMADAATPPRLRLTGIGPLTLGMTRPAAVATGWLANPQAGCEFYGPTARGYDFTGPQAPAGLVGNASFTNGKLVNISFRRGVQTHVGVRPGVSTRQAMVRAYRQGGFVVTDRFQPVFQTRFITARRGGKSIQATTRAGKVFQLSIPLTEICD